MRELKVTIGTTVPIEDAMTLQEIGRERGLTRPRGGVNMSATLRALVRDAAKERREREAQHGTTRVKTD